MKKRTGTIELKADVRSDGTPLLKLMATDESGQQVLTRLLQSLDVVRIIALKEGKADIHDVCEYNMISNPKNHSQDLTTSLTIALALGGIELKMNPSLK